MSKRILTGIQPSGTLHIGNYFGAMRPAVTLQDSGNECFYFKNEKQLFSGDTLFRGTYGRTDFPGGSAQKLFCSIRTKLFTLPDDINVWPGHNDATTIGNEKRTQFF